MYPLGRHALLIFWLSKGGSSRVFMSYPSCIKDRLSPVSLLQIRHARSLGDMQCRKGETAQTPGLMKSGYEGQLPSLPGSPPIRTQVDSDGVGPSSTNN